MPVPFIHGRDLPVSLVQRMLWVTPLIGSAVAQRECWQLAGTPDELTVKTVGLVDLWNSLSSYCPEAYW